MNKYESGQSLIEILLALALAVVVITGITFGVTSSLKNATFSKNQNLASSYAQEGMEIVRGIRDRSLNVFTSLPGGPNQCLAQNSTTLVPRSGPDCNGEGNVGIFIREITLNNNSSDCTTGANNTKVTVQVKWSDNNCPTAAPSNYCHKIELISCFSNFNFAPIP